MTDAGLRRYVACASIIAAEENEELKAKIAILEREVKLNTCPVCEEKEGDLCACRKCGQKVHLDCEIEMELTGKCYDCTYTE